MSAALCHCEQGDVESVHAQLGQISQFGGDTPTGIPQLRWWCRCDRVEDPESGPIVMITYRGGWSRCDASPATTKGDRDGPYRFWAEIFRDSWRPIPIFRARVGELTLAEPWSQRISLPT